MEQTKTTPAAQMAFGGIMAALSVVLMSIGGVIPVFTYITPMICTLILQMVLKKCGQRVAWAWYGAVSILGIMICADKESAAVFLFIGYYPIVKPFLEKTRMPWLNKLLLFNASIFSLYYMLLHLIGLKELTEEFSDFGTAALICLIILGNITFFLLDNLLSKNMIRRKVPAHGR